MSKSRDSSRLRVVCQFCHKICYTKKLEWSLVCRHCGQYAKYNYQKLIKSKIFDRCHKMVIEIYEVVEQSKPCTVCSKLTPTDKVCCSLKEVTA
jgi:hypothetical protein